MMHRRNERWVTGPARPVTTITPEEDDAFFEALQRSASDYADKDFASMLDADDLKRAEDARKLLEERDWQQWRKNCRKVKKDGRR
jgi:hypothetical protein